jgi:hypothetical protein
MQARHISPPRTQHGLGGDTDLQTSAAEEAPASCQAPKPDIHCRRRLNYSCDRLRFPAS